MPEYHDRRGFLLATSQAFAALAASGCTLRMPPDTSGSVTPAADFYGPLVPDPDGLFDLPKGFSYRVLSRLGDAMDDGGTVPDKADGMGCFDLGKGEIALIRNHELMPSDAAGGPIANGYDRWRGKMLPGGTTTIVLDAATLRVKRQFRSLGGTIRNCGGGVTPWGSWLSCEEPLAGSAARYQGETGRSHGWVFEVPANASGLVEPFPIEAMGRFNHEAACVDPATGIVYQTEDREDGVLYRYLPDSPGRLGDGGRLQAMALDGLNDTRNRGGTRLKVGEGIAARWIDLDRVDSPADDLRHRAAAAGAALIARGEGIHMGRGELYLCATSGGAARLGQIFRYRPGRGEGGGRFELFFESERPDQFNYGDNLTVAPNGHLIVCEDQYTEVVDNHIRGITPDGVPYPLARLRAQTELAGACFSPDGATLFVNIFAPAATLAIRGPWVR